MAHINITRQTLGNIYYDDIAAELQQLMFAELEKAENEIDTDFIDECTNALLKLETERNNSFAALVPLMSSEAFLRKITGTASKTGFRALNKFLKTAIIAAVLTGSTLTANAMVEGVTGVNLIQEAGNAIESGLKSLGIISGGIEMAPAVDDDGDEETTTRHGINMAPAVDDDGDEDETTTTTKQGINMAPAVDDDGDDETTTRQGINMAPAIDDDGDEDETTTSAKPEPTTAKPIVVPTTKHKDEVVFTSLLAEKTDEFKTDYIYGEEFSYNGLKLYAVYSDGSKKEISLSDCRYTPTVDTSCTGDHTVKIVYNSCILSINITVRPDELSRGSRIESNDDYDYLLTENGVYITAYKGNEKIINLRTLDDSPVIAIGAGVFEGSDIKYINLNNTKYIFANAFRNCAELEDCYSPTAIRIGDAAFENCTKLREAIFSSRLESLGASVYKNTGITTLTLPDKIEAVPEALCENCSKLEEVSLCLV